MNKYYLSQYQKIVIDDINHIKKAYIYGNNDRYIHSLSFLYETLRTYMFGSNRTEINFVFDNICILIESTLRDKKREV